MIKKLMRTIFLLLAVSLLATCVSLPMEANAAVEYYNTYSDVDKITDYGSCGSMQGLAVGSQKLYSVKNQWQR